MVKKGTRRILTAYDIASQFEEVGEYINRVRHEGDVFKYLERHLGLTSAYDALAESFDAIRTEGHYVLIGKRHIIYGRVLPSGKRILYDPQIDEVVDWERATGLLGSKMPQIHRIIRE